MTQRVSPTYLFTIRSLDLEAKRLALQSQLKTVEMQMELLRGEQEYGTLGTDSTINVNTGLIKAASEEE